MSSSKKTLDVKKRKETCEQSSLGEPKKLTLLCVLFFISAMFLARLYNALQRSGILGAPNIIGGFHLHHWTYSFIALMILIPLAVLTRKNAKIFPILVLLMAFFFGLFVDGIVYPDSVIFYE